MKKHTSRPGFQRGAALCCAAELAVLAVLAAPRPAWAGTPTVPISPVPLTVAQPAHPQVLMAVTNSESMDGNLSGAIMAGSGSLPAADSLLQSSSSPLVYTIPAGFTPPLNLGGLPTYAAGTAPYTVTAGANLADNSPSRLNVAKAGIATILSDYMAVADFGLIDFSTSGTSAYTTWVYHQSPVGGNFTFTGTQVAGLRYVANPCYNYTKLAAGNTVRNDCSAIAASGKVTGNVATSLYMQISTSSDDPLINDVLYAGSGGIDPICIVYGGHQAGGIGPDPATPYPPNYTLLQFNANLGNITESYSSQINSCAGTTYPTNAGFIGDTPQEMYVLRGWAYGGNQNVATGSVVVPVTTAGAVPTSASVTAAIAKFSPYLAPETNNSGTSEIKASAGQSAVAGILAGSLSYYTTKNPPSSNGCTAKRYVVLVTDGLPTVDLSGGNWPPPGTASAAGYGMTVAFNADNTLNVAGTSDKAMKDTITELQALYSAGIKTYVIGLGAGVDPTVNPTANAALTAMALAGGSGAYFPATSPATLAADMDAILVKILAETAATSSVAENSTGVNSKSVVYQGQFTTSDTFQDWTGNLLAYQINAATGAIITNPPLWASQPLLDAQSWDSGRYIATWDPVATRGIPFRWTTGSPASGIASSTSLGAALSSFTADTSGQDVLQFIRGRNDQEVRNGGTFRNRTHKLGDIVDSVPLYVAGPAAPWLQGSYANFVGANANRSPVIYVGADDGMLHAFDGTTGNPPGHVSGSELFAYVPYGVFANLVNLVSPYYNENHLFFVDGSPQANDVQFGDGSWHTVLVGGERAGGKSIFALDVTNPPALSPAAYTETPLANAVLWEFTDANMGYSYSAPTIGSTAAGFAVFFGNGYNSPTGTPYLYALNPQTGAVIAKINLCTQVPAACSGAAPNGLSNVVLMNTFGSLSQPANVLYAGDLQGNVWRVDISNANPAQWSATVLFQARDSLGNPQAITTTPAVTLNPLYPTQTGVMVYVVTGQFLGLNDLSTTQVQTIYGIFDSGAAAASPLLRGNLVQQTMSSTTTTTVSGSTLNVRLLSNNIVSLPAVKGWFVDLSLASGERVFNDPILFNGTLQVVSYQPNTSSCTAGGTSYYMVFSYATGGRTTSPQFDVNGDGKVTSADLVGGQTVAGFKINGYASNVTALRGGGNGGQAYYSYTPPCTGAGCGPPGIPNIAQATTIGRGAWQEIRK